MGGWLDPGDIKFIQLFDVAEDVAELRAEFFFLVRCELQSREMRDVFDVNLGSSHAGKLESKAQS